MPMQSLIECRRSFQNLSLKLVKIPSKKLDLQVSRKRIFWKVFQLYSIISMWPYSLLITLMQKLGDLETETQECQA